MNKLLQEAESNNKTKLKPLIDTINYCGSDARVTYTDKYKNTIMLNGSFECCYKDFELTIYESNSYLAVVVPVGTKIKDVKLDDVLDVLHFRALDKNESLLFELKFYSDDFVKEKDEESETESANS